MLLVPGDELQTNLVCGNETLKYSKQETVLGVTTKNKLIFATCLSLTRVQKYMTTDKKKRIFSSFIRSQLTYCPLGWIFCTKYSIGRINSIHELCLRLIQQNYTSDFEVLLENSNEKPVH